MESISALDLVAARADELVMLAAKLQKKPCGKRAFQTLPPNMRRRAASHNPKRVPQRIRQSHLNSIVGGVKKIPKPPSRKHRRRPKNLLEEYNRRQRNHAWLETHIWHAKRFHMIETWGYKLAHHPNDKSFRACYRAATQHCLMQDKSFLQCLEMAGPQEILLERLGKLTNPATGTSFGSIATLGGTREGTATVYQARSYPLGVIGHVSFMWKPMEKVHKRTLWLWIHPSIYSDVFQAIQSLFPNLEKCTENCGFKLDDANVDQKKLEARNVPFERTPKWSEGDVTIAELKGTLNRFALRGPASQKVLSSVLRIASVIAEDSVSKKSKEETVGDSTSEKSDQPVDEWSEYEDKFREKLKPLSTGETLEDNIKMRNWWKIIFSHDKFSEKHLKIHESQAELWESLENVIPGQLPSRKILGLTVRDPRVNLPPKRDKQEINSASTCTLDGDNVYVSQSCLWSDRIRDRVTLSKISDNLMNRQRSSLSLGEDLSLGDKESRIPVILLQSPGAQGQNGKGSGLGAGWDLILPAGWGMAFWIALVYNGARVGGLREEEMFNFECGLSRDLLSAVDSTAGKQELQRKKDELMDEYFKRPPNNRSNLIKINSFWNFEPPFARLVKEWSETERPYYLLRDHSALLKVERLIEAAVAKRKKVTRSKLIIGGKAAILTKIDEEMSCSSEPATPMETDTLNSKALSSNELVKHQASKENVPGVKSNLSNALIPVRVIMLSRGSPEGYSALCLPSELDLEKLDETTNFPGPVEPLKEDPNEKKRREMRSEHTIELKKLKRKRKEVREELFVDKVRKLNEKVEKVERKPDHCYREEAEKQEQKVVEEEKKKALLQCTLEENLSHQSCSQYREENRKLWLPVCDSVRFSNTREIIGFTMIGGFSYSESKGAAFGYIVAEAVDKICDSAGYVLVREATSQQYRVGVLSVLL